jgi:hypothetical protein
MIAGPPQHLPRYDSQGRERSLLLKKIQGGKMERSEMSAEQQRVRALTGECEKIAEIQLRRVENNQFIEGLDPNIAVRKFDADFLEEDRCRGWILRRLHKEAKCPRCHGELTEKQAETFWRNERVQCGTCKKFFTALTDKIFSGIRMNFREIVLLLVLLGLQHPAKFIASRVHCDASSVRIWRNKFKSEEPDRI